MTAVQIFFWIISALTLVSALLVVTRRNLVHAAFYLIAALLGVAVFFVLLEAGFLAVVQIVVYIGAIAILIIMGIMVTRNVTGDADVKVFNKTAIVGLIAAALVCAALVMMVIEWQGIGTETVLPEVDPDTFMFQLGTSLFAAKTDAEVQEAFVLPTILASVLLLAALIGAIVIAWQTRKEA
jgi:NADH-quinone oxidoreductase subunit J